jgi:RNA polymerase sigma-70 factor (ECF subfamily)
MTDGELVRLTLDGRPSAYEQLVRRWMPRVLALCHARIRTAAVAEELAQETLLRGYRSLATLESPGRFGAWLRGIAVRVCLDWIKSKQSSQVPFSQLGDGDHDPLADDISGDDAVAQQEEWTRLAEELERLPEQLREVLLLYYYDDMSYEEIGSLLEVSRATVNTRLAKARKLLRIRLGALRN